MDQAVFIAFGEALAIGLLIGAERYRGRKPGEVVFGGVRTFSLLALLGALSGLLVHWALILAVFCSVAALIALGYHRVSKQQLGLTTEVAALLTFWLGYLMHHYATLAISTGIIMVVLLAAKHPLHQFVKSQVSEKELYDTLKFLVVVFVVFPLLPNRDIGPYGFLNPTKIWVLIVLVSSISFAGYLMVRLLGGRRGLLASSLFGGIVSTTALTMAHAAHARRVPKFSKTLGIAAVMANSMQFPRVLFLVWFVSRTLGEQLALPLTVMFVLGFFGSAVLYRIVRQAKEEESVGLALDNPYSFLPALKFGLFFVGIFFLQRIASTSLGEPGVYLASALGGFGSMSAVALSTAELVEREALTIGGGTISIFIGMTVNALMKGLLALVSGSRSLAFWLAGGLATALAIGGCVMIATLWPL